MARRVSVPSGPARVTLSEVLPYEVPPQFSNRKLYRFFKENEVRLVGETVSWKRTTAFTDIELKLLMGIHPSTPVVRQPEAGRLGLPLPDKRYSRPFHFPIARAGSETRRLSIVHPRHQLALVEFYRQFDALIPYHAGRSPFSLRRPVAISRYTFDDDQLHRELRTLWAGAVETKSKEAESFRSYFVYQTFSNIYKFFESEEYQNCEKRFANLTRLDVSKCFDSIYTHSVAWAVYGKDQTKLDLKSPDRTKSFPEEFDYLMQRLNYNETNGIVVGPEFSRLFAEIILQSIDEKVRARLEEKGLSLGIDYDAKRYVDDYFVFTNHPDNEESVTRTIREELREFGLHLNSEKAAVSISPHISPISIAKLRLSRLFDETLRYKKSEVVGPGGFPREALRIKLRSKTFITDYKTILKETGALPSEIVNYALSIVERRLVRILKRYSSVSKAPNDDESRELFSALIATVRFVFFAYSGSPRVNPSVKLCRVLTHVIAFAQREGTPIDLKRALFDEIFQEVKSTLDKSRSGHLVHVENLYLLASLEQLGRDYLLREELLLQYFSIELSDGKYNFKQSLSHLSLTTLLHYLGSRHRYAGLRSALEKHVLKRIQDLSIDHSEKILLQFDLIACPHVSPDTKSRILLDAGIKEKRARQMFWEAQNDWFTKWRHFDLGDELDRKRNQEVY